MDNTLVFNPGINPEPDETKQNTRHIIDGNNIRFRRGGIEKTGGHSLEQVYPQTRGCARALFSFVNANKKWTIIGTSTGLYAKLGSSITNITPLKTSGTTLGADPLTTGYDSFQSDPFGTTSGSKIVTLLTFMTPFLEIGDTVTITGVLATVNGIPAGNLNGTHTIINIIGNAAVFEVATAANATGFPTLGANPNLAYKKMLVTHTAHGLTTGDRVKISGDSGTVGGIPNTDVNGEHVIVVGTVDEYAFMVNTTPTSFANGGGGAVVEFTGIASGGCNAVTATGPGIGVPGFGLPGSIQTDTSLFVQPRIWWQDAYGSNWVGGPGQGGGCYQWAGDTAVAPVLITNAPAADWGWIEDAKLVTLLGNKVKNSDTGDLTAWTPGPASSAYEDDKEDATKLITRCYANGENLVCDDSNKVFSLTWIGGTAKWRWKKVSSNVSIAGPHCCIEVDNIIYVMGTDNFYYYNGGALSPLPDNTLLKYVITNINLVQRYKFFAWYNHRFDELNFHYASSASNEPDRVAIINLREAHWTKREDLVRSAADRSDIHDYPLLAHYSNGIYQHEIGYDDNGSPMEAYAQIAFESLGNAQYLTDITGLEPDLILTGDLTIELYGKDRARDDATLLESFTLSETDDKIDCDHETRWRSWIFRSDELGGYFRSGGMREFIQPGAEF